MTAAIIASVSRERQACIPPTLVLSCCVASGSGCSPCALTLRSSAPDNFKLVFSFFAHLVCTRCGRLHERDSHFGVCPAEKCGGPLFARYHDGPLDRDGASDRPRTIWRWHEMMPVEEPDNVVSLGEGGTPLLTASR